MPLTVIASMPIPLSKVFMAETATFALDSVPGVLSDFLVQTALNKVFIPLIMLTTASLNRIEHNDVKFKCINYGTGEGKKFLNEASFSPEDSLNDFEFGQAYTNWLTLIETVSDPMVELGWCMHHKRMTVVHEFLDWEPAW